MVAKSGMKADSSPVPVEGFFTICVSFILVLFLPGSPSAPKPLLSPGLIRFNNSDKEILQRRLEQDVEGGEKVNGGGQNMHIPVRLVWETVSHWRRWPHYVSTFAVFSTWSSLTTYTPSIVV